LERIERRVCARGGRVGGGVDHPEQKLQALLEDRLPPVREIASRRRGRRRRERVRGAGLRAARAARRKRLEEPPAHPGADADLDVLPRESDRALCCGCPKPSDWFHPGTKVAPKTATSLQNLSGAYLARSRPAFGKQAE
jgi:hypothetical protein